MAVASVSGEDALPRTTSSSFITLAGLKKCVPATSFGRFVIVGELVDVQRGGVGKQQRARLHHLIKFGEYRLLDVHLLEHRLDHEVAIGDVVVVR